MSPTAAQRPVPIRPSPAKCLVTSSKPLIAFGVHTNSSPSTLTPPRTSIKRKLEEPSTPDSVKCKRRINFTTNCVMPQAPAAVARRNARERNRVKQVNNGFATLRQHIPGAAKAKKISKVETLKQAVDYIRSLQSLLDENDFGTQTNINGSSSHLSQIPSATSAYDFTPTSLPTVTTASLPPGKLVPQYTSFYYSENVSPVCASIYPLSTSVHSPACSSDGATSSPSPSYISDNSSYLNSVEQQHPPVTILPEEGLTGNLFLTETFAGNFGMQYLDRLEEEDFIETCIESWETK